MIVSIKYNVRHTIPTSYISGQRRVNGVNHLASRVRGNDSVVPQLQTAVRFLPRNQQANRGKHSPLGSPYGFSLVGYVLIEN